MRTSQMLHGQPFVRGLPMMGINFPIREMEHQKEAETAEKAKDVLGSEKKIRWSARDRVPGRGGETHVAMVSATPASMGAENRQPARLQRGPWSEVKIDCFLPNAVWCVRLLE